MVELRKRKAHQQPTQPPPAKKKSNPVTKAVNKVKAAVTGKSEPAASTSSASAAPSVGSTITLDGFGGEIETNDGQKTTLEQLVEASTGGVVLFTYPKASTPGCKFASEEPVELQVESRSNIGGHRHNPSLLVPR